MVALRLMEQRSVIHKPSEVQQPTEKRPTTPAAEETATGVVGRASALKPAKL
jgi:hypothetical protein